MAVRGAESLARSGIRRIEQLRVDARGFRELFRPAAVRAVREAFVLDAIARKEGISVSDEALEQAVQGREGTGAERGAPSDLVPALKADGRWERLRTRLRQDRTLDWVIEQARVEERELHC